VESQSLILECLGDGPIHPDHFTPLIQQWSARVTGINCGVCLNKADSLIGNADKAARASCGTDDTSGNCVVKTEGVTNRDRPFTRLELLRVTQSNGWQVICLNLDQRLHPSLDLRPTPYPGCTIYNVGIGKNATISTNDEAGARTAFNLLLWWRGKFRAKELFKSG